jgi:DNA invertase Pin-like site-specific DNA recombinase
MTVARAKGRLRGKQPKLSPMQEAHLVELYRAGEHTVSELEELFSVTRSTVYRGVRRAGGRADAATQEAAASTSGKVPERFTCRARSGAHAC